MNISPRLLSRLHRIVAYFYGQTMQVPLYGQSSPFSHNIRMKGNLDDLIDKGGKGRSSGGGGGTARGLRVEKKDPAANMRRQAR